MNNINNFFITGLNDTFNLIINDAELTINAFVIIALTVLILISIMFFRVRGSIVKHAFHTMVPKHARDDPRLYSDQMKRKIHYRARRNKNSDYGTCEWILFGFFSCRRKSTQADHWFPHARGGKTNLKNAVALCEKHNKSKSAKIPSWWMTTRISMKRKGYYHFNDETRPGDWMSKREIKQNMR